MIFTAPELLAARKSERPNYKSILVLLELSSEVVSITFFYYFFSGSKLTNSSFKHLSSLVKFCLIIENILLHDMSHWLEKPDMGQKVKPKI